eukprot:UN16074
MFFKCKNVCKYRITVIVGFCLTIMSKFFSRQTEPTIRPSLGGFTVVFTYNYVEKVFSPNRP